MDNHSDKLPYIHFMINYWTLWSLSSVSKIGHVALKPGDFMVRNQKYFLVEKTAMKQSNELGTECRIFLSFRLFSYIIPIPIGSMYAIYGNI